MQFRPCILLCLLALLLIQCKQESDRSETAVSGETDTRILLRQAYAQMDRMNVTYAFNKERADMLRTTLSQTTDPGQQINLSLQFAAELLKSGQTADAIQVYEMIMKFMQDQNMQMPPESKRNLYSLVGITYMRHGELENCVQHHNHESCFIPIRGEGVHQLPFGSRNAIRIYEQCLTEFPSDLESRYLLNLAYMTLGEYPQKVPRDWRIDPSWFSSDVKITAFKDVAPNLGVNRNGHAGGVVIDDFNNDGWLDIVVTSWVSTGELILYLNNGDGTFSDRTRDYGLQGHTGALHLIQTDFNNDGWLDLYLLRGAWYLKQGDLPNTLLMNTGKGSFEDVTLRAGLGKYAPTQTAAWADFNLDGWLDLVVANESLPGFERGIDLYINQQDGTFSHQSEAYGLTQHQFFKGCVVTDANNDGYPDIYFSSLYTENSLYINQGALGKNQFVLAGPESNVRQPVQSFPCWSFDFDNDGMEDLFVSSYNNEGTPATHWMNSHMKKLDDSMLPRLYHNTGKGTYENVGSQMGLNEVIFSMGCNFGDINTDGFLDFYLGTGNPEYQSLVPNKMYLNMEGRAFADVSYAGGFANIQKGHGISFGDLDRDGDEDIYAVMGGAYDGDVFFNCLFENPNTEKNNWVVLKLEGTTANRPAIGARVKLTILEKGKRREIHRTVTSGASFGANSLALEIGLRKAETIEEVFVKWPCAACPDQTFSGLEINSAYHLTQNEVQAKKLVYTPAPFALKGSHGQHH